MIRPRMVNGWVLAMVRPPAVAHRTCATNVDDSACLASWMNSSSLKAGSGCLSTTGARAESKKPIPLPSTLRWLCTSSESGASSSQNVALTRAVPELSPNKRHTALSVPRDVRPGQRPTPYHPPRIRFAVALATSSRHHTGPRPSPSRNFRPGRPGQPIAEPVVRDQLPAEVTDHRTRLD